MASRDDDDEMVSKEVDVNPGRGRMHPDMHLCVRNQLYTFRR